MTVDEAIAALSDPRTSGPASFSARDHIGQPSTSVRDRERLKEAIKTMSAPREPLG